MYQLYILIGWEANQRQIAAAEVWRRHQELLHLNLYSRMRTQTKPRCCWEELCRCRLPLAAPPRPYLCYLIAITSAARRSSRGVPCPAIRGLHTLLTQYLGIPKLCVFATHFILVHTRAVKSKIYQLPLLRVLNLPLSPVSACDLHMAKVEQWRQNPWNNGKEVPR